MFRRVPRIRPPHYCLALAALLFLFAVPPSIYSLHFPIKTYTVADGLLRDSVYRIKQDSRGFLWFCTPEGISRFDGYSFTNFTTDDGLPDRHVNDFLQTSSGEIYLATDGGLARLEPNGTARSADHPLFTIFEPPITPAVKFQVLLETHDGHILGGSNAGIFLFDGETLSNAEFPRGVKTPEINDLKQSVDGRIWAATARGVFYSDDGARFALGPELPDSNATTITQDREGKLWIGLRPGGNGGLCRLDALTKTVEKCFTKQDGLPSGWITSIFQSHDGQIWIGTTKSLCEWQGEGGSSVCRQSTATNDICNSDVWNLLEDKDDNLWIGSRCGLKKISSDGFSYFNENDGLGRGLINSIFEDRTGALYTSIILPEGRQISRLEGDSFRSLVPRLKNTNVAYFGWGWKQTIVHDRAGAWWVPTGAGLYHSTANTRFEDLDKLLLERNEFPANDHEVFRLFEDSNSDLWLATSGNFVEVWRWRRTENKWDDLSSQTGVGRTRTVTGFAEDAQKNMWITTGSDAGDTALIEIRNGKARVIDRTNNDLIRGWLRDEYFDEKGRLWVASTATGLLEIDDPNADQPEIKRYSTSNGMSSTGVYCVTEDGLGNVYAGTGRGVDRLDPSTGVIENFTTFDGLPDSTVEICYRDRQNVLWFGTSHGLARYVPPPAKSRQPPAILITGLRVNGEARSISVLGENQIGQTDLSPAEQAVSVDFVGLGATLGEKLRYEYKLNDADWQPTVDRTLSFAGLQKGTYVLMIRAVTRDSIVSDRPARFDFRVAAPIWQRWWFILLVSIVGAAIVYFVYRSRVKKLLELERTRTRIATDLHDDIGSNLSKIALLSELVKMKLTNGNDENNRMLATIADVSRSTVNSMRDIVWSINPARDSLLELTRRMREHAEETLVPLGIAVRFQTDESESERTISMDQRRELLLIFKEAINNAARHSGCRRVAIDLTTSRGSLSLEVADDGMGFDPALTQEGNGLANMRSRAEKINATLEVISEAGKGSRIAVRDQS